VRQIRSKNTPEAPDRPPVAKFWTAQTVSSKANIPTADDMKVAQNGDTVKVHYTGRLTSGEAFDSSEGREPLEFTIGDKQLIAGFEDAVIGMNAGDTKTVTIPAAEAYGEKISDLIASVERTRFPDDVDLEIGQQFRVGQETGDEMVVTVTSLSDTHVTIDANHPLAGQELIFDITLSEIV
jgi:peptidylprolyl isomerase